MTARGYHGWSCDRYLDASGVTATQACSVACSGGDITSCQEYDNCWDSPCLNGGVCTDGLGTFTCACPAHYGGAACELYSGPNRDWVSASLFAVQLWLLSQLRSGAACWRFASAVPRQRDVGWLSISTLSTRWI
jgi:hypothetical protein